MSVSDLINKDDDGHLLRAIISRIESLEAVLGQVTQPGMIVMFPGDLRSNDWSIDHKTAVGSNWSRWYQLNDVNLDKSFEDASGLLVNRPALVGTVSPKQGQPGFLRSEGSYSVEFDGAGNYLSFPHVAHGTRSWTLEAIFCPDTLPQTARVVAGNGGSSTGPKITIGSAAGGSGSLLTATLGGVGVTLSTGITLAPRNWYHAIFVGEAASTMSWYLGRFNPVTRFFSFLRGSVAMPTPPLAANANGRIGDFDGWVDEALAFNGVLTATQAEDRIRAALQPPAPNGWLVADGAEVPRNQYARLFDRIGTFNGSGDGSTTFNLPNYPGGIVKV